MPLKRPLLVLVCCAGAVVRLNLVEVLVWLEKFALWCRFDEGY
jgi:hypothetical protein